jgi:hypothetical protein
MQPWLWESQLPRAPLASWLQGCQQLWETQCFWWPPPSWTSTGQHVNCRSWGPWLASARPWLPSRLPWVHCLRHWAQHCYNESRQCFFSVKMFDVTMKGHNSDATMSTIAKKFKF